MRKLALLFAVAIASIVLFSCRGGSGNTLATDSLDSIDSLARIDSVFNATPLPDTAYASAGDLVWKVYTADDADDGQITDFTDYYSRVAPSVLTFRGNLQRTADFGGMVTGTPSKIEVVWEFKTDVDFTKTSHGSWGGGTGWTGQPLYVEWPAEAVQKFKNTPSAQLTANFGNKEIVVSSLCGKAFFINFETGKASRQPINVINPIKGTPSIDPRFNGMYYVGHGIQAHGDVCQNAVDLFKHEIVAQTKGIDPRAARHWPACDGSAVMVDGYLFWPSENGLVYKYNVKDGGFKEHSVLRYVKKGDGGAGVENSICIYKNYGYFGDNHGDIVCINLNTMKPVWHYDNHDDIDGTIVCEVVEGVPYIYTACEIDRRGDSANCYITKLNGLNGEQMWSTPIHCTRMNTGGKHFDGGMYSSPLLGKGDCEGMLFTTLANDHGNGSGSFYAFNTATGEVIYRTALRHYAWSSPVGFYNENGKLFVLIGDTAGNMYLINGKSGEIITRQPIGHNFESSPVVVGNCAVVGSRGESIFKLAVK